MKIIVSVVGLALTSICCGQLLSQSEVIPSSTDTYHPLNIPSVHPLVVLERTNSGDQFDPILLYRSYYKANDNTSDLGSWNSLSLESNFYEAGPVLEEWMTEPFMNSFYEAELEIEAWMTEPFILEEERADLEEELEVEDWMSTSWI